MTDFEDCEHDWNDGLVFSDESILAMCDVCGCVVDDKGSIINLNTGKIVSKTK